MIPRYPVYVISKGRWESGMTAKFLIKDKVPFKLVVEPQEFDLYAKEFGAERILVLPFSNPGLGGIPARNWCWEHAKAAGHFRHWILDDNIRQVRRLWKGKRIPCNSGAAFAAIEDFTDRYENLAIAGMNYTFFAIMKNIPPFFQNCHVYSCLLIQNDITQRWRGRYNEDTDLCLQVLSENWCTALVNVFLIDKAATMTCKGGNMETLYQGDGRLKMARALERQWPGVVKVDRRYERPQHVVKDSWRKFDTQLKFKSTYTQTFVPNEYGLNLKAIKNVKSQSLRDLLKKPKGS